ncbi:feather beta keratin-like [Oenanthe melanoleuca]|uniref:feather beta keratin-like n=1 Tax=Oenanthe melanoleuca TaxID=2939378 RepID=UPI0024C1B241|nr:feather beta keratin-like [Oenanthe melanoleuca]
MARMETMKGGDPPKQCSCKAQTSLTETTSIKAGPDPLSLTYFASRLILLLLLTSLTLSLPGTLHTTPMACYNLCTPCGPTPLANSCNEPCALQCQDSRVIINPSPVLVTLPGPIMTSFPQSTAVGSTSSAAVGTELSVQGQPISGGFGGFGGFGYGRGFGYGLGGLGCGYGRRGGYNC